MNYTYNNKNKTYNINGQSFTSFTDAKHHIETAIAKQKIYQTAMLQHFPKQQRLVTVFAQC